FLFLLDHTDTPPSPLLPYTTLFRSGCGRGSRCHRDRGNANPGLPSQRLGKDRKRGSCWRRRAESVSDSSCAPPPIWACGAERCPDRKSTRLNSSHGSISYAVFCLKK